MLGKQSKNSDLFQCVTMEDLVPKGHVLRRLNAALDPLFLQRVREEVAPLYAQVGRASVDPEVVVRMWLLQHFYGFSERQVVDEVIMHAGFRWFCGLSFNDPVPDQSTLVKLRTEKWADTDLWEALLQETVRLCEAAGIARPKRMGIDGTQIDANAAISSLEALPPPLEVVESVAESVLEGSTPSPPRGEAATIGAREAPEPAREAGPQLDVVVGGNPRGHRRSGDPDWHGERFSNATHRSTTDPEARLYRKGKGEEAALRYLGHYLAGVKGGVIYGAMATQATGTAEREAALALLDASPHKPKELVGDLAYRDGDFLAAVIERGVQPLVPIGDEPLEEERPWQRRVFDLERHKRRVQARAALRASNATRLAARGRRGAAAQRQRSRLEHLIGEGKEHHGLGRAHGRGLVRVDQQVKLTASVQNLKRLLRTRHRRVSAVVALTPPEHWLSAWALQIRAHRESPGHPRPVGRTRSRPRGSSASTRWRLGARRRYWPQR